jgi:hypothetical protein
MCSMEKAFKPEPEDDVRSAQDVTRFASDPEFSHRDSNGGCNPEARTIH